ncbi:MAG: Ldh family oxidoreductase [Pseudomonadales bacterium]
MGFRFVGLAVMLKRFLVPEKDRVFVSEESVRNATKAIFLEMGQSQHDAEQSTDVLITSDLRGCESHGVSNMLRHYVYQYRRGELNPTPSVTTLRESAISATWDADQALGIHVGPRAMELAIEKANETGIGAVAIQNCGHVGMLAYYPLMAIAHDMIGICMVSAGGGLQVPVFGSEPAFGTNPIAWAAPAEKHAPFVFDVATTQVAANKLMLTRRIGSKLEPGWITTLDGEPIMESVDSPDYGGFRMLPFGGTRENGGHKGYGFAIIVDIMAGILSGNGPGFIAGGLRHSQFVMAIKIDAFVDIDAFKFDLDKLLEKLSSMTPAKGHERVYYAGLIEQEETIRRKKEGIPYHYEVVDWFNEISVELGLNFSLP